jgi:hypothetical protein
MQHHATTMTSRQRMRYFRSRYGDCDARWTPRTGTRRSSSHPLVQRRFLCSAPAARRADVVRICSCLILVVRSRAGDGCLRSGTSGAKLYQTPFGSRGCELHDALEIRTLRAHPCEYLAARFQVTICDLAADAEWTTGQQATCLLGPVDGFTPYPEHSFISHCRSVLSDMRTPPPSRCPFLPLPVR